MMAIRQEKMLHHLTHLSSDEENPQNHHRGRVSNPLTSSCAPELLLSRSCRTLAGLRRSASS